MKAEAKLRFLYPNYGDPDQHPDYSAHSGQVVTIIRPLKDRVEYDYEGDKMFEVIADDGWKGHVWESELHTLDFPWPTDKDQNGNLIRVPNER